MHAIGPVLFPFTGTSTGGSHISTFTLADALRTAHGVPVEVSAPAGSSIAAEAHLRGLPLIEESVAPKRRRLASTDVTHLAQRRARLAALGPRAVVHVSDLWTMASWGPAAKSLGLPIVYHNRAFGQGDWVDRRLLHLADAVVCISDACRTRLKGAEGMDVTNIVNPFSPPSATVSRAEARAEWEERWPIAGLRLVGTSGNFTPRKRPDFFIDAAAVVAAADASARFVLFGHDRDGSAQRLQARAGELGIADRVALAGFRSPPERNLAGLDVLAVPALAEPFGRTLVEALMLDVPYVATDDAGHGEIARTWGGGLLVPRDAEAAAFGDAIVQALNSPPRLDTAARDKLFHDVEPATHAARVLRIYCRLFDHLAKQTA
jgi:glycosyltransferase involved in cell wall biosynthesis